MCEANKAAVFCVHNFWNFIGRKRCKETDRQIVVWLLMFFNDTNCTCKSVSGNKALAPGINLITEQVSCQEFTCMEMGKRELSILNVYTICQNTGRLICTRIFGVGECVGFCFNDADCMM